MMAASILLNQTSVVSLPACHCRLQSDALQSLVNGFAAAFRRFAVWPPAVERILPGT